VEPNEYQGSWQNADWNVFVVGGGCMMLPRGGRMHLALAGDLVRLAETLAEHRTIGTHIPPPTPTSRVRRKSVIGSCAPSPTRELLHGATAPDGSTPPDARSRCCTERTSPPGRAVSYLR
jgi:hypothetical protein